jgi:hypothetical protein
VHCPTVCSCFARRCRSRNALYRLQEKFKEQIAHAQAARGSQPAVMAEVPFTVSSTTDEFKKNPAGSMQPDVAGVCWWHHTLNVCRHGISHVAFVLQ